MANLEQMIKNESMHFKISYKQTLKNDTGLNYYDAIKYLKNWEKRRKIKAITVPMFENF